MSQKFKAVVIDNQNENSQEKLEKSIQAISKMEMF